MHKSQVFEFDESNRWRSIDKLHEMHCIGVPLTGVRKNGMGVLCCRLSPVLAIVKGKRLAKRTPRGSTITSAMIH